MAVAFSAIPGNLKVPLFYAEFNAGRSPFAGYSRQVLIGHKTSAGSASVGSLVNIGGSDPRALFGSGSMLCDMAAYAREMDPVGEIYALVAAEPGTPTAASGTVVFANAATTSGTFARWIAGERVEVNYTAGDSAATIAARFAAAVNAGYTRFGAVYLFPVSASVSTATVTLTARNGGAHGNAIRIEAGVEQGSWVDPSGTTITHGATLTGGVGVFDLAAALALLGSAPAEWIAGPWNSSTQLNASRDFLGDTGSGRWAPMQQLGGHYTTYVDDTLGNLTTLGSGRNDRHATILGGRNRPNTPWVLAAALNGALAFSKNLARPLTEAVEISRPMHGIVLPGIKAPVATVDRWNIADRQTLYVNGISTLLVMADGQSAINTLRTTERLNGFGQPDPTFERVETMAQSAYVGRYMRAAIEQAFPRHALRDDGMGTLPGVVTPRQARSILVHAYRELCAAGICEKPDLFAANVIVERSSDPNRLNAFLPIDVVNQLVVFAANITVSPQLAA